MTLSCGDEVDDDFLPHVTWKKTVRMRKRPPFVKDVFLAGDGYAMFASATGAY